MPEGVPAEQPRFAAGRPQEAEKQADRRGLARAVGAEEPERLALGDAEGDVLHAPAGPVELGEAGGLDDEVGHRSARGCHGAALLRRPAAPVVRRALLRRVALRPVPSWIRPIVRSGDRSATGPRGPMGRVTGPDADRVPQATTSPEGPRWGRRRGWMRPGRPRLRHRPGLRCFLDHEPADRDLTASVLGDFVVPGATGPAAELHGRPAGQGPRRGERPPGHPRARPTRAPRVVPRSAGPARPFPPR